MPFGDFCNAKERVWKKHSSLVPPPPLGMIGNIDVVFISGYWQKSPNPQTSGTSSVIRGIQASFVIHKKHLSKIPGFMLMRLTFPRGSQDSFRMELVTRKNKPCLENLSAPPPNF